jgi:hypothetical protein
MRPQPWIKPRVRELGKTLRGLGQAMGGLDGARLTEIMAGTRRVQPVEIEPMARYLEMPYDDVYRRLFGITPESRAKSDSHSPSTSRIDTSATVLVPLWDIVLPGAASGDQLLLSKSGSWESAPQELRLVQNSFAVRAWDDDNAPWVARGATLFVNPSKKPRDGQWGLFFGSGGVDAGEVTNPSVGLLLGRRGNSWAIQRGMARLTLALAEWPFVWLVEWIKP